MTFPRVVERFSPTQALALGCEGCGEIVVADNIHAWTVAVDTGGTCGTCGAHNLVPAYETDPEERA